MRPPPALLSQSLSQSYGSVLPTSLTYFVPSLEAAHLEDLLRLSVRRNGPLPLDLHGPSLASRTAQCAALPSLHPPRQPSCFRGHASLARKDHSSRCLRQSLQVHCVAASFHPVPEYQPDSLSGPEHTLITRVNLPLRTDSPDSLFGSVGTFPHFSLQSPPLNICYSHQDLH